MHKTTKILLAVLMSLASTSGHSQLDKHVVDSLSLIMTNSSGNAKIDAIIALANGFKENKPARAIDLADEGLSLITSSSDSSKKVELIYIKGIAQSVFGLVLESNDNLLSITPYLKSHNDIDKLRRSWRKISYNYMEINNHKASLDYSRKLLKLAEALNEPKEVAIAKTLLAGSAYIRNDYPTSLRLYDEALQISLKHGPPSAAANAYGGKGSVLLVLGQPVEAFEIHLKQLEIFTSEQLWTKAGISAHHTGYTLQKVELYDEANIYYKSAMNFYEKNNSTTNISYLLVNMGEVARMKTEFQTAEQYFEKSIELDKQFDRPVKPDTYIALANLYVDMGQPQKAINIAEIALKEYKLENNANGIAWAQSALGRSNFQLNQIDKAERLLNRAYTIVDSLNLPKDIMEVSTYLNHIYQEKNDYKQQVLLQKNINLIKDSLYSIEQIQKVNAILIKKKLQEQSKITESWKTEAQQSINEITNLEQEQRQLKNKFLVVLGILFGVGIVLIRWRKKQKDNQVAIADQLKRSQVEQDHLETQLSKRNQEVNDLSVNLARRNQALQELKNSLTKLNTSNGSRKAIDDLMRRLHLDEMLQEDWNYFQSLFHERYPEFFEKLRKNYPSLSQKDLRLCGLIRSDIAPQEVADILGITLESVHSARYRLRKKFDLDRKEDLDHFIKNI